MEFTFKTVYDQKAVTAMARALRKTIRRKRSRRVHIFGWFAVALAVIFTIPWGGEEFVMNFHTAATWTAGVIVLAVLLFEDTLNAYIARKRVLTGMDRTTTVFSEEGYTSASDFGKSEFRYENIVLISEMDGYFVFIFDKGHGQIYDKSTLSGGTMEEFQRFLSEKTGKEIQKV